ncbi:MAG: ABC transporter ATP-binding protein [Phycisphaerales bacterium]
MSADVALEDVGVRFGRVEAVSGVTAVAAAGRVTALLGPNASGKSTILRTMAGLLRPTCGQVQIGGVSPGRMSARDRAATIAWVPARPTVAAPFTVAEVVAMGRHARPADPAAIADAMERMDLGQIAGRRWPELSTGQQQRCALARAMAQRAGGGPGVLILDEPSAGLDLRHVAALGPHLRAAADGGSAVVVAVHDLAQAAEWADDAWLINGGRLALAGDATSVVASDAIERVFGVRVAWADVDGRRVPVPVPVARAVSQEPGAVSREP